MKSNAQIIFGNGAHMDEVPSGSVNLILTSPPYYPDSLENILCEGAEAKSNADRLSEEITRFAISLRGVFAECERVLAPDGIFILQTRDVRLGERLISVEATHRALIEATGLILYTRHLWKPKHITIQRRRQLQASRKNGMPRTFDPEVFLVFKRASHTSLGQPTEIDLSRLEADIASTPKGKVTSPHHHQSPIPMLESLIRCWSKPGDTVLDPFCGGGTTLLVANQLGRQSIGYEINAKAFDLATKNLGLDS